VEIDTDDNDESDLEVEIDSIADGKVHLGSGDGTFYVLNATNGSLVWSYPIGGEITSSAAISNGRVYVGSSTGTMYAFRDANETEEGDGDEGSVTCYDPWLLVMTGVIIAVACGTVVVIWKGRKVRSQEAGERD